MTLEEAVEIVECGRFDYCHPRGPDYDHSDARASVWDRARAIVDQAVRFVKAREQEWDGLTPQPGAIDEFYKLRALERGEEISKEKA
jgi:hypothetical protein